MDSYVSLGENKMKQKQKKQTRKELEQKFCLLIQSGCELSGMWVVQATSWGFNA